MAQRERLPGTICRACRAEMPFGALVCARCGARAPALPLPSEELGATGVPTLTFAPSSAGPPLASERNDPPRRHPTEDEQPTRRLGYRPILPPEPTVSRRTGGCCLPVSLALVAVAALALLTLLLRGTLFAAARPSVSAMPTATVATTRTPGLASCPALAATPTSSSPLADPRLATALVNAATGDYRPARVVTSVRGGEQAYLTFRVATATAGTAGVTFCTPGGTYTGAITIPAGSSQKYAEFPAAFTADDRGRCSATVLWNGVVVTVLQFEVT